MNTLFPIEPALPNGFVYHPDFMTSEEEQHWLERIATIPVKPMMFQGYEAKRKVASFGFD